MLSPTASFLLPFTQATAAQRAQILQYLQTRLRHHFPTLPERAFARALAEFRPDLLLTDTRLTLSYHDLTQLVQYLAASPELPLLDPPIHGPWALDLAQYALHLSELAIRALVEVVSEPSGRCGPHLWQLLRLLAHPYPLAEQVVQAQRWDLPGSPRLPSGISGGGPAPGSIVIEHLLRQLDSLTNPPSSG